MVIVAKKFILSFIRPQDMLQKSKVLVPACEFANCNLAFYVAFGVIDSFTVDNDTLSPASASILMRSFTFFLGLI